jgi:hypothetical protein
MNTEIQRPGFPVSEFHAELRAEPWRAMNFSNHDDSKTRNPKM